MSMPVSGAGPSKLFVADSTDMVVGSLANPNPAAGTLMVDRMFGNVAPYFYNYPQLSNNMGSLALDTMRDYLYIGNGTSIKVIHAASIATGDLFADATFGTIGNTSSMFLDAANDRLYVGDEVTNVKVYSPASTASLASPTPRLVTGVTTPIHGVAVDVANDILYVSCESAGMHQISVFNSASSVTTAAPDRAIVPTVSMVNLPVAGISLDAAHHLLYVAPGAGSGDITVFDDSAHNANNAVAPTKTLTIASSAQGISSVWVDSANDRLYAVGTNGHVYLVEAVSMQTSGMVTAKDASLSGSNLTAVVVAP